jgi:hypothetical protein
MRFIGVTGVGLLVCCFSTCALAAQAGEGATTKEDPGGTLFVAGRQAIDRDGDSAAASSGKDASGNDANAQSDRMIHVLEQLRHLTAGTPDYERAFREQERLRESHAAT